MSRTTLARHEKRVDFYPTPAWCVRRLLEAVELPGGIWLEPAVGERAIVDAVASVRSDVRWWTIDVRPEVHPDLVADFTAPLFDRDIDDITPGGIGFDVAITNPPFSQAAEFVRAARRRARVVVMLLRLGWLASRERHGLLFGDEPDVYVLPDRPSFTGEGADSADYAWMVWRRSGLIRPAELRILRTTPAAERRARA